MKKYYKRQAFLVHPDKNNQPGAEEAFKILVHAFELIGEPVSCVKYCSFPLLYVWKVQVCETHNGHISGKES